jgi:hypothetical protein
MITARAPAPKAQANRVFPLLARRGDLRKKRAAFLTNESASSPRTLKKADITLKTFLIKQPFGAYLHTISRIITQKYDQSLN